MRDSNKSIKPIYQALLALGIGLGWAVNSFHTILRLTPHRQIAMMLGMLGIALAMYGLDRFNRKKRAVNIVWFPFLFLVFASVFVLLYPSSVRRDIPNLGSDRSDREDALRIELNAVVHHEYPYNTRTFLGNPPTPLPGAMLLASPFFALGHIAWQNLLWLAVFFVFTLHYFRSRATALFFLVLILPVSLGNFSDWTSGGDYLINFFYVAIAVALVAQSLDRPVYAFAPAALFLGVTISSRIIYVIFLIPLFALALQRTTRQRAIALPVLVLAAAAAVTVPVFAGPHLLANLHQQLEQNASKLDFLPAAIHAQWSLPLLAAILCCIGFFIRMDLPRVFLLFGVASCTMLAPSAATMAVNLGNGWGLTYLAAATLPFSLWAASLHERISLAVAGLSAVPEPSALISTGPREQQWMQAPQATSLR